MNTELAALATSQGDVFSPEQSFACGVSRARFRAAVRTKEIRSVRKGAWTWTELWDAASTKDRHLMEVAAAVLLRGGFGPGAGTVAGGLWSAGFLHELPVRPRSACNHGRYDGGTSFDGDKVPLPPLLHQHATPTHVDLVSGDRGRRTFRFGVDTRPAELPAEHIVFVQGVALTTMARTAVDLMRASSRHDAVIVADAVLATGVGKDELQGVAQFCARWPYGTQAVWAADLANGKAESAAESLARLVLVDLGLTDFEQQVKVYSSRRRFLGRVDFLFRAKRVVLEVDGKIKYLDPWCGSLEEALRREAERQARLESAGWIVVRTTWDELLKNPGALYAKLMRAFALADAAS